jgi:aspartate kinase
MEQNLIVRGIAFEDNITRISILGMPNAIGSLSNIFTLLAKHHINVDIIIQSITADGNANLSFSIKSQDIKETLEVLESNKSTLQFEDIETETGLAKVSIVGSGMVSNPGVAAEMFSVLSQNGIQIKMVSTSEIKVSTVVDEKHMITAVESLHEAFQLDVGEPSTH